MKSINITPLGDRVLVLPEREEDNAKTKSGIIIPDTIGKERPEQGTVVAVGEGRFDDDGNRIPMSVTKGQIVLFSKYGPDEIKIDGKEYLIISESNILAIIDAR